MLFLLKKKVILKIVFLTEYKIIQTKSCHSFSVLDFYVLTTWDASAQLKKNKQARLFCDFVHIKKINVKKNTMLKEKKSWWCS